jgi:hypothetical protein
VAQRYENKYRFFTDVNLFRAKLITSTLIKLKIIMIKINSLIARGMNVG